jgi:hypothetical protein
MLRIVYTNTHESAFIQGSSPRAGVLQHSADRDTHQITARLQ